MTIIGIICFPESPTYLHNRQKYDEARESMAYIARFNGNKDFSTNFLFDDEIVTEEVIERLKEELEQEEANAEENLE